MAYAVELTVRIGSAAPEGVEVSLTYHLEGGDTDFSEVVSAKIVEAVRAYQLASLRIRATKANSESGLSDVSKPLEVEADEPLSPAQEGALRALLSRDNRSEAGIAQEMKSRFGVAAWEQLTARQATCWLLELQRLERQRAQHETANNHSNGRSQ